MDICCWKHASRNFKNEWGYSLRTELARKTDESRVKDLKCQRENLSLRSFYSDQQLEPVKPAAPFLCLWPVVCLGRARAPSVSAARQPGLSSLFKRVVVVEDVYHGAICQHKHFSRCVSRTSAKPSRCSLFFFLPTCHGCFFFPPSTCCPWPCNLSRTGHPPLLSTGWKNLYKSLSQTHIFCFRRECYINLLLI